jgi:hypothetical protein
MNVVPAVEVKSFQKCTPGDLVRFLNDEGNSSFGVVVTQTNEWQDVDKLIYEIRDGDPRLSYHALDDDVISIGSEWDIVLSDFDIRSHTKGQLKPGTVLLKDVQSFWYLGSGDPSTGGLRGVSIKDARASKLPFVRHVAYTWSIRLPAYPENHPWATEVIAFSAKPTI